mmetsp:Transcript_7639/g.12595  ORF Transcript_7639/g.12595 Transcript_7639/m.12595 type:complete len:381 (-) Transcript_7639:90-1232(-)
MSRLIVALVAPLVILASEGVTAFTSIAYTRCDSISSYSSALSVFGQQQQQSSSALNLSPLPKGISPFEKSLSKNIDIQGDFRKRSKQAIDAAIANNVKRVEIEFPPLLGGSQSKSQFDDFDNIQELDKNKEWTMQLAPTFLGDKEYQKGKVWMIFPDLKECELAKTEWAGQRYQEATFTTIQAVTNYLATGENASGGGYDAPWGENLMSGLSKIMGGKDGDAGLLGDQASLDPLVEGENSPAKLWLVIQPGNGGPVEDWVNCEKMALSSPDTTMVVINGALDKVRGGFYPAVFFPKLAATVDRFWKKFDPAFYLKPFSDKGVYGWLYRVYPEPWQVHLEVVKAGKDGNAEVDYVLVDTMDEKPSYDKVVSMLLSASRANK